MRNCPYCGKTYPDDATVCAIDGESLIPKSELSLEEDARVWIEESFQWLLAEFGEEYFLQHKIILPEASFFPDKYDGTEEAVTKVVGRVCSYMDVNPETIDVKYLVDRDDTAQKHRLGREDNYSGAAGLYFTKATEENRRQIAINVSVLKNPTKLVGTIAHELGHVILLGGDKISQDKEDHEYLTDLFTVFIGLGIFTANSAFEFSQWQDHSHHGWSASHMGYMSEEMFAYSLAAYAWMRGESKPKWSTHLAMNVGHYFKESLKYFEKGGQTSLKRLV